MMAFVNFQDRAAAPFGDSSSGLGLFFGVESKFIGTGQWLNAAHL